MGGPFKATHPGTSPPSCIGGSIVSQGEQRQCQQGPSARPYSATSTSAVLPIQVKHTAGKLSPLPDQFPGLASSMSAEDRSRMGRPVASVSRRSMKKAVL